jgi:hypothetical protein
MRVQTSFEKFAQMTNGGLLAFCLVAIRMLLGLAALGLATAVPWAEMSWLQGAAAMVGLSFLSGLAVRPSAWLGVIALLFVFVTEPVSLEGAVKVIGLILLLGVFAAGGSSHIFGLDGLIFRNLRRPSRITKFIFG